MTLLKNNVVEWVLECDSDMWCWVCGFLTMMTILDEHRTPKTREESFTHHFQQPKKRWPTFPQVPNNPL